jgi:hypothetical protein
VAYDGGGVTVNTSFIVPFGNATTEEPAVFMASGLACTALYQYFYTIACPLNSDSPAPIANVDLDIPGFMTFTFQPGQYGEEAYSAMFTPVPEPATALLLLPAFAVRAWWSKRKRLKGARASLVS